MSNDVCGRAAASVKLRLVPGRVVIRPLMITSPASPAAKPVGKVAIQFGGYVRASDCGDIEIELSSFGYQHGCLSLNMDPALVLRRHPGR